jgi:diacylglycerol kinase (ATP)
MSTFNVRQFRSSVKYALRGLRTLFKREQNARIHLVIAFIAIITTFLLQLSAFETALVFFAIVLVFGFEIMNTAIEKLLDLVHPHTHSEIAFIKDALAGAVLIAAIIAAVVFCMVAGPHIVLLLHSVIA